MSQSRRRRRRRRRGTRGEQAEAAADTTPDGAASEPSAPGVDAGGQPSAGEASRAPRSSRRRRRRRGRPQRPAEVASSETAEEVIRRPSTDVARVATTVPADGRTLENVIGELQSTWGVPQHPQEFRITVKVAEERIARGQRVAALEEVREEHSAAGQGDVDRPRREKAPAAPRIGATPADSTNEGAGVTRRKRSRRRRRRGGRGSTGG
jgi:hypothetical protein